MKPGLKQLFVIGTLICLLPLTACSNETTATASTPAITMEQTAIDWVNLLPAGKFDQAVEPFDKAVAEKVSAANLKEVWNSLISQLGAFESVKSTKASAAGGYSIIAVTCQFHNTLFDIQLTFGADKKIAGLFFQPSSGTANYNPPAYADTSLFTETEVTIGTGQWRLPGTLTVPKGDGPFPAVVLVHGSGPNDRDETIINNKPFKDLAWGLASRGIAVLRYEKRTKQYPAEMVALINTFTVQEEVIDDAIAAVTLFSETAKIDQQHIYVVGHSLGAMLTPNIAAQDSRIAGIILLAGLTRNLADTILDQYNYLALLDGKIDEKEAEQIRTVEQQVLKIKNFAIKEGEVFFGSGKAYWEDLMKFDNVAITKSLTIPMLILQGERDYQVTMVDYNGWVAGLKGMNNVTFKLYANLNHLFMTGTGKSSPAEYNQPGNINQAVIEEIAAWIKSQL